MEELISKKFLWKTTFIPKSGLLSIESSGKCSLQTTYLNKKQKKLFNMKTFAVTKQAEFGSEPAYYILAQIAWYQKGIRAIPKRK